MRNKIYTVIFILFFFAGGNAIAQTTSHITEMEQKQVITLPIAFVNSNELLELIPDKKKASDEVNELNRKYKDELQLMQNDYNKKYSDFISYQTSMAENIRLRRMQELYELEQHINAFMEVAQEDVLNKEKELLKPLRARIKEAIYQVGVEGGFICVYDLANPSILFVTPEAVDITNLVKPRLGIK